MSAALNLTRPLPHPRYRLPFAGDILSIDSSKPVQKEMAMADELGGIYERKIFKHRLVVVSDPALVAEVNNETHWAKFVALPHRKLRQIAGDGLFTAYNSEPAWHSAHAVLGPAFNKSTMRDYHGSMQKSLNEMTRVWDAAAVTGDPVDAYDDCSRLAFDVIGHCALSHDFQSFRQTVPLADAIARSLRYVNTSSNDIPLLRAVAGRAARNQHVSDLDFILTTVEKFVDGRLSRPMKDKRLSDLLQHMLDTANPSTGQKLSMENIRNQVVTFVVAGNETTASTMAFALHYLSRNPSVVEAMRGEIDEVAPDDAGLGFVDVPRLRRTRRVVDETLRLWPAAPGYFRKARSRGAVDLGGYNVPEGWVFVLLPQLHRSDAWGPSAREFDPDRFKTTKAGVADDRVYKPWGTGLRACIGRQFALHEAMLTLATLVRRYDITSDPEYRLDVREAITLRPHGVRLWLSRRT